MRPPSRCRQALLRPSLSALRRGLRVLARSGPIGPLGRINETGSTGALDALSSLAVLALLGGFATVAALGGFGASPAWAELAAAPTTAAATAEPPAPTGGVPPAGAPGGSGAAGPAAGGAEGAEGAGTAAGPGAAAVVTETPGKGAAAGAPAPAQAPHQAAPPPPEPARIGTLQDPPGLSALKYRQLGPAWGGRVSQAVGVPGNPNVFYLGSSSGGVFKSADGGLTWSPVFDDQPVAAVGSLALAPSDPNVIYVGTGEANLRGNAAAGDGIYKSLDGGKTWSHVLRLAGHIGALAVDPRSADTAFAAVLGHGFGPNLERGVYRTRDGGRSWQLVLKKDAATGASDVAIDPGNPNIVFAGLWQVRRYPWTLSSGGPGSGLYLSRDGGDTWKQLTGKGLPEGIWGKVGVAVAPSDGRRVYALIEAEEGGLFRSDDGGDSWTRVSASHELRQRAFYYTVVTVAPNNPDDLWCAQVTMLHSIDGGKTFQHVSMHHGDHHYVWIDPRNPRRMIASNDGGVDISTNGGESWTAPALALGQIYHISADSRRPFRVSGDLQDIGSAQGPSDSLTGGGIPNADWYDVGGGEAGYAVPEPADPEIVYAGEYGGLITRYDHRTGQSRVVGIYPENPSGHGGEDLEYRFQWTAPIASSPNDPRVIYHAANVLFRTADGGQTWTAISPDLTRNDKSKQTWAGGPITGDNTGVEIYDTIFAVAESPVEKGLIWAGSDDGLVHVTRDGGAHWQDVTGAIPGLPAWATVATIEPSHFAAGTAYLVADAHRLDDVRPYLWRTTDFGRSWKRLDAGLPRDIYLHAVREDPAHRGLLYVGSERGVVFSADDGATWHSLRLNMAAVAVHDLVVKDGRLALATHGRSFWIFDHLTALHALFSPAPPAPDAARGGAPARLPRLPRLLAAPDVVRWDLHQGPQGTSGENPPHGAVIYYQLASAPKGDVTLDILDAQGIVVTTLSSEALEAAGTTESPEDEQEVLKLRSISKDPGVHLAVWDLTWAGAELIPGARLDSGYPAHGPRALPGAYTARLTVDGRSETVPFNLLPDPRVTASASDLEAQLRLGLAVRDAVTRLTHTVLRLRAVRRQLRERNELLQGTPAVPAAVPAAGQAGDPASAAPGAAGASAASGAAAPAGAGTAAGSGTEALIKGSADLAAKLDALEAKLENPKAEIVYDILAQKGGAQLYSRLSPLLDWVDAGDGAPTEGQRKVFAGQQRELAARQAELEALLSGDLAALNQEAARLSLPVIYVPPPR